MKRHQNLILLLAVVLLAVFPLWLVSKPAPDANGEVAEIFAGADDQARNLVGQIDPDYKPWFSPLIEPASGEIASLLFALQAALGAGFIGYYLGVSVTREKVRRELAQVSQKAGGKIAEKELHAD
jgi:cobalt/nickel transport protein